MIEWCIKSVNFDLEVDENNGSSDQINSNSNPQATIRNFQIYCTYLSVIHDHYDKITDKNFLKMPMIFDILVSSGKAGKNLLPGYSNCILVFMNLLLKAF